MKRQAVRIAIGLFLLSSGAIAAAGPPPDVRVDGTEFVIADGGRVLRSPDLVGAILGIAIDGVVQRVRIDSVERDPLDLRGQVWLHTLSIDRGKGFVSLCGPSPLDGKPVGFPIMTGDGFEIACADAAFGKCVRLGFHPWSKTSGDASEAPLHRACVHMLRADYSGRDRPTTRDGTMIDIYDRWGLAAAEPEPGVPFEAGWDDLGAVCVAHPRIAENVTLAQIEATIPRLKGRTGAICTRAFAQALGATVFNGSKP